MFYPFHGRVFPSSKWTPGLSAVGKGATGSQGEGWHRRWVPCCDEPMAGHRPAFGHGGKRPPNLSGKTHYLALDLGDIHRLGQVEANHRLHRLTIVVHLAGAEKRAAAALCQRRQAAGGRRRQRRRQQRSSVTAASTKQRVSIVHSTAAMDLATPLRALGGQSE